MPDNPDWTGQQALTAAPLILQATHQDVLVGGTGAAGTFGLPVTPLTKVRLFGVRVLPNSNRFTQHCVALLRRASDLAVIAGLEVSPNRNTDYQWFTPPYDLPVNVDLATFCMILDGQGTDTDTITLAVSYNIVSG